LRPRFLPPEMLGRWRELQGRCIAWDSPFLSPYWPRALERAQDGVDRGLRIIILYDNGRPQGFMAVRKGAYTAMAAGAPLAGCEGFVAAPDIEPDPMKLVRKLGVQRFDFSNMLNTQPGFSAYARGGSASRIVDLADGYKAYAAQRKSVLKELSAKRREAEREVGPITFAAGSTAKADLDRLIELKRGQSRADGQTDIFAAGWPERLLKNLLGMNEPGFAGLLFTLRIGGQLAAAQFHLAGERSLFAWMAVEEAPFARYSAGLVLTQHIMRWMDKTPYERIDLGTGDAPHQQTFANAEQPLMHGFVGRPSAASLMREAAYRLRDTAERLPLGAVSMLPGKAMQQADLIRGLR